VNLDEMLTTERAAVEEALGRVLPAEDAWPERLHRAMRYAVLAGGKRVRPILARLAHRAAGGHPAEVADAVSGIELLHTYSLVHDDLPALDDDTIGGFMMASFASVPQEGEELRYNGVLLRVLEGDDRQVRRVLLRRLSPGETDGKQH